MPYRNRNIEDESERGWHRERVRGMLFRLQINVNISMAVKVKITK